ncbi:MAG: FeoB-associated Cys-rich membrane protein [Paludibacter sp.]|nr:FeoB-associated Cys-rich membrane protein [Paludibacter sp.]
MIQNIIVYLIIAGAVGYTIYSVIHSLKSKNKSPCDGCGGCDIKNEILKNQKGHTNKKMTCYH